MAKLELALLVGAESKEWLARLEAAIEKLEGLQADESATKPTAKVGAREEAEPRKRASKKGKPAPVEEDEVSEGEEQESAPVEDEDDFMGEDEEDEKPLEPTIEDVRKIAKQFAAKHGKEKTQKLLQKFGGESIPEIKKSQYKKLIDTATKYL